MTKALMRFAAGLAAVGGIGLFGFAEAQIIVTDGTARTSCTSYTVQYSTAQSGSPTISMSPAGCLGGTTANTPYFSFAPNGTATASEAQALANGGAFNITYTVNLERYTNATPMSVTVEACAPGTGCTATLVQDYYLEGNGAGQGFPWSPPYRYTLNFAAGETSKTFVMAVADNLFSDGTRTLTFSLINPSTGAVVGTPGTQSLQIADNEPAATTTVGFDVAAPAIMENASPALAYIGMTRANGTGPASVKAVLQGFSTGVVGTNFALDNATTPFTGSPLSYTVNFANGELGKGFFVRVIDAAGYTGNTTAVFALSNPVNLVLGTNSTSALTIVDKDPAPPPLSGDYDISGTLIPSTTTHASAGAQMCENFATVNGQGPPLGATPGLGGSQPCGAYRIPVSGTNYNCSVNRTGVNAVNNAYLYVLEDYQNGSLRRGNSILWGMLSDAALVFKFKTGSIGNLPQYGGVAWGEQYNRSPIAPSTVMTLSESKCDFDNAKIGVNGCYVLVGNSGVMSLLFTADGSGGNSAQCALKPDSTYYLNIRYDTNYSPDPSSPNLRAKSCATAYCGQYITIN